MKPTPKAIYPLIGFFFLLSLLVGWRTPEPMIGDEVTHYFMLSEQAEDLSRPNFISVIPVNHGEPFRRQYAHSFGWHYLGALVYRAFGRSYAAVQFYHALYWLQLMVACYLLSASRGGNHNGVSTLYTLLMASLPMSVLFSVALYQEIPVTAQIVTSFLLLSTGHWIAATFFMAFALMMKVSAFVAFPAFALLLLWRVWRHGWSLKASPATPGIRTRLLRLSLAALLGITVLGGTSWGLGWALQEYVNADFYPVIAARRLSRQFTRSRNQTPQSPDPSVSPQRDSSQETVSSGEPRRPRDAYDVIAHHPGDLRFPRNWLLYFGGVFWLTAGLGLIGWVLPRPGARASEEEAPSAAWLWIAGLGYLLPSAYILRSAPDARFFMPAIPFLLLPLCEKAARIPFRKWVFAGIIALGLVQSTLVYRKTYQLRNVSEGLKEAIAFLEQNMPVPPRIFMYPEGNYRLFPTDHEWYLNYGLRDFWAGDNDFRIQMLNRRRVGAVVVKKHLVAPIDADMNNLGVYPPEFVRDLKRDPRFELLFENEDVLIFSVPLIPAET